jgi:hypothetical protein
MPAPLTPIWRTPAQAGLLSNKYAPPGETFTARCRSTGGGGDPAGNIRITAMRQSDQLALWDSGVIGRLTTTSPPLGGTPTLCGGTMPVSAGGALTVVGGRYGSTDSGDVMSAPTMGGTCGSWTRRSQALAPFISGGNQVGVASLTRNGHRLLTVPFDTNTTYVYVVGGTDGGAASNYPQCIFGTNVGFAELNPDGSYGPWRATTPVPIGLFTYQYIGSLVGHGVAATKIGGIWYIYVTGGISAGNIGGWVWYAVVNDDGTLGAWTSGPPLDILSGCGMYGHVSAAFGGVLFCIGGTPTAIGNTVTNKIFANVINPDGSLNAWLDSGITITTALRYMVPVFQLLPGGVFLNVIMLGGNNGTTNVTTTQYIQLSTQGAVISGTALSAAPQAGSDGAAAVVSVGATTSVYYLQGSAVLYSAPLTISGGAPIIGTWSHGVGATALATADLGTNGSVTTNADGSQDLVFQYGRFGPAATFPVTGDAVTLTVQVAGTASGNPSPVSSTAVQFGDPPTATSLSLTTNGQPSLGFTFAQGTGGGPEQQWEIQLLNAVGNTVLADSGVQYGTANSVTFTQLQPPLAGATQYMVKVLATQSTDQAMPGSSGAVATTTALITTGTLTPPAAPTFTSVTADNVHAMVTLTFSWAVNTRTVRMWYRRTGATPWALLADYTTGTASAGSSTYSTGALVFNVGYDFALSAVSTTANAETALTAVRTATIAVTSWWLRDPADATASVALNVKPSFKQLRLESLTTHYPLGSQFPVVVADTVHGEDGTLTVWTSSPADDTALLALLLRQATLLLHHPYGELHYIRINTTREVTKPYSSTPAKPYREYLWSYVEVGYP